jgi:hypothetical protein
MKTDGTLMASPDEGLLQRGDAKLAGARMTPYRRDHVIASPSRRQRRVRPPSGFEGHLGRREAAALLGLPSEFKIRQFEKQGRLRPVRGAMGSAFYARVDVLALRPLVDAPVPGTGVGPSGRTATDADVLALLRSGPKTLVDLVIETGISVARARRLYTFWTEHERRPRPEPGPVVVAPVPDVTAPAPAVTAAASLERRSPERVGRTALIARLRDPDPQRRAAAFVALKRR